MQDTVTQLDKILKKTEEQWEKLPDSAPAIVEDAKGQISELQVVKCSHCCSKWRSTFHSVSIGSVTVRVTLQDRIDAVLKHQPMLDEMNQRARELDKKAALPSQTTIEQTTRNINERWALLTTKVNCKSKF